MVSVMKDVRSGTFRRGVKEVKSNCFVDSGVSVDFLLLKKPQKSIRFFVVFVDSVSRVTG